MVQKVEPNKAPGIDFDLKRCNILQIRGHRGRLIGPINNNE